jgi:hypothetical protein
MDSQHPPLTNSAAIACKRLLQTRVLHAYFPGTEEEHRDRLARCFDSYALSHFFSIRYGVGKPNARAQRALLLGSILEEGTTPARSTRCRRLQAPVAASAQILTDRIACERDDEEFIAVAAVERWRLPSASTAAT